MTKYILHGGYSRAINKDNNEFFREMTEDFPKGKIRILLCYFAREENEIEKRSKLNKEQFIRNSVNKNLKFEIADAKKLAEQLKTTDVFYMDGGETKWLMDKLKLTPNLTKFFGNKTVVGCSAGAYTISKYYFSDTYQNMNRGFGWLNIKVYCHYDKNKEKSKQLLADYKEKLPLIVLSECKWQVIYQ